jgi:hypothetical protein
LLVIFSCTGYGQKPEIYGKWYFDRFGGPHGEIANDGEIGKANRQNEGMTLTFTKDNKAILQQKSGAPMTAPFQLLANRKEIVLRGDTMRIMLLNPSILELYPISDDKPAMFLKRNKDGKTAIFCSLKSSEKHEHSH